MITESKQKRVLLIVITILLLANVATLVMFFVNKPVGRRPGADSRKEKMNNYLKKELGYNDVQLNTYQTLVQEHKSSVDNMFNTMRREKESRLKDMAAQNYSDSSIEIAAARSAENQKELEIEMLRHLKAVRALGDASQRAKFDTGFLSYMNRNKLKNKN